MNPHGESKWGTFGNIKSKNNFKISSVKGLFFLFKTQNSSK